MVCVNVFYVVKNKIFQLDPTKDKEFPHRPQSKKIAHFGNVISIAKVSDFYNGGLWGNFFFFVKSSCFVSDYIENVDAYHVSFSLI